MSSTTETLNFKEIELIIEGPLAIISINRPAARNSLNKDTIVELTRAFTETDSRDDIRCILFRGAGDSAFCAGADLEELKSAAEPESRRSLFNSIAALINTIQRCNTPVVALVYGFALAGGLGLLAASDIVIASEDAEFGLPEVAIGLAPLVVSAPLSLRVSEVNLRYLALTGERINSQEALRIGLVNKVTAKALSLAEALAICKTITQRGPNAIRAIKTALRDAAIKRDPEFICELADRSALISLSDEASEGILAFSEKRKPLW